jgi:DNA-binding Lrp family transcriptional regulator
MFDEKSVEAYMLLVVEHGADEEVLQNLTKIEGIEEASLVLGEYDIHCKLRVESMKKMREILAKVRKLRIMTSETLVAYEKAPRVRKVTNRHIRKLGHKRARH